MTLVLRNFYLGGENVENIRRDKDGKVLEVGQLIKYDGIHSGRIFDHPYKGLSIAWVDGVRDSVLDNGFDYLEVIVEEESPHKVAVEPTKDKASDLAVCKRMLVSLRGVGVLAVETDFNIYGEDVGEDYTITSDSEWVIAQFPKKEVISVVYEREGVVVEWTESYL